MDEILNDKRFAHIPRDPAFKRIPKRERKVIIDKRFQSMFSDKRFKVKYTVDKRGRPIRNSSSENLKRYYAIESSEESDDGGEIDDSIDLDSKTTKKIENKSVEKKRFDSTKEEHEGDTYDTKNRGGKLRRPRTKDDGREITFPIKGSRNKDSSSSSYVQVYKSDEDEEEEKEEIPKKMASKSIENKTLTKKKVKHKNGTLLDERDGEKPWKTKKKSDEKEISSGVTHSGSKVSNSYFEVEESSEEEDEDGEEEEEEEESDSGSDLQEGIVNDKLDRGAQSLDERIRTRLQDMSVDYARGEGVILSDSSSEEESSDEDEEDGEDVEHGWGELDQDAVRTNDSTRRLAVCSMDWDRLRAPDLMVLFHSFLPKGGIIHSVTVYPSEYGLQRMKIEEEKGPLELRADGGDAVIGSDMDKEEKKKKRKKQGEDEVEGDEYQIEKLRQYQLNRLRYFYAVIVCDSVETADALYKDCDGMEYESSAARLDLRFIPDDTSFDQEPRETCTELPNMTKYEPQYFVTTALQQSKVRLTWDETDPRRAKFSEKIMSGKVDEVDDNDLKVYLATSSSEGESSEEEDDEKKEESASKYRALVESLDSQEAHKKEKDMEMQVTWGLDLKQTVERRLKDGKTEELTPFQVYLQKRKEKRKARKEEQKKHKQQLREAAGEPQEGNGGGSEDDVPSDVDMNDAYFKEEFEKEEFLHTKKKDSNKKKKKDKKKNAEESEDEESKRKKAELELLLMDGEDSRRHFSLKDILVEDTQSKKKKKKQKKAIEEAPEKKDDDFQINLKDDRFSALFTSHLYNIDPADPHYKKTKGMEALRQEKLSRRQLNEEVPTKKQKLDVPEKKQDVELSQLIKNIKRQAQILKK